MKTVLEQFGIDRNSKSLYKYSPVYRFMANGKSLILKKTKRQDERIGKLFAWQKQLNVAGIKVVEPEMHDNDLYKKIGEDNWVVYPYIEGRTYCGSKEDIYSAGEMLGKIHALSEHKRFFNHGFDWSNYGREFTSDAYDDLGTVLKKYDRDSNLEYFKTLKSGIENILDNGLRELRTEILPFIDGTWDYKANNLIYKDNSPYLIDADNGARIPRIFDLGLALILFHNEMETAPNRMFNTEEWEVFKAGYQKHINITMSEKKAWKRFLVFIYADEALWAITNLEDDESEDQKEFIRSLLLFNPDDYKL